MRWYTRKDLAQKLELSTKTVARNEDRLGLNKARVDVNQRNVRYDVKIADQELKKRNQSPS